MYTNACWHKGLNDITCTMASLAPLMSLLPTLFDLIPSWISNLMLNEVWDAITDPFPNSNGCTVEVWEWVRNFIPHFVMDVLAVNNVSKRGPWIISRSKLQFQESLTQDVGFVLWKTGKCRAGYCPFLRYRPIKMWETVEAIFANDN